eukprot:Nitzschia sp. Nitz4//scaffold37_size175936//132332//133816//NITZ4_002060-RA/size175936-processed-gene-0.198-mRNA-1//1//CDS//3329549830//8598//frame0
MATFCSPHTTIFSIPHSVQVHILSYLRAYDLSALQLTCHFFNDSTLMHDVVVHTAEHVYTTEFAPGIVSLPSNGKKYTLEDLRSIELNVVARVLSLPEPKTGFYISKSWVKKTLLWLETVNEPQPKKKLNKKQQRQRARRLSEVSPPWPNANSDLLCSHCNLQRCGVKAARSRRRLMDKHAWKILKRLYPDSTQLESVGGECLQCLMETETARKSEQDRLEQEKAERKKPLSNPLVRRFYTRTRGVCSDCLVSESATEVAVPTHKCPLKTASYVIIPRAWCHQWRHYMKTGEGGMPLPPDSSALLCDAHKNALVPPHLEAYLSGETPHLMSTIRPLIEDPKDQSFSSIPVGMEPPTSEATINALLAAGMSRAEVASQQMAMLQLETQRRQAQSTTPRRESSIAEVLDRENHVVVELVTEEEWLALQQTGCWPKQLSHFAVRVEVDGNKFRFSTNPCRECDPTGSRFQASAEVKYRRKRWEPKSVEQRRTPRVEY